MNTQPDTLAIVMATIAALLMASLILTAIGQVAQEWHNRKNHDSFLD